VTTPPSQHKRSLIERLSVSAAWWLVEHTPKSRNGRILFIAVATVVLTLPSAALLVATILLGEDEAVSGFRGLSFAGVFLANFLSTATVVIPVPGLLAIGQALIVTTAQSYPAWLVGLTGGAGMGLGETTAYVTGLVGAETARVTKPEPPSWLKPALEKVSGGVSWLMSRYGLLTLFVLSAIPDPVFEVAGIMAGATRVPFLRFLLVVVAGNCVRGLTLAYAGREFL
jgi:membrane protein DedA with SNARE-associated domain